MFHLRKVLSLGEKRERSFSRIFVGLFSFIGIVFILIGIGVAISRAQFLKNASPVEAEIIAMHHTGTDVLGMPVVKYSVDGQDYTGTLSFSSSDMHPGRHITVYYHHDNPENIRSAESEGFLIGVFLFIGLVFAAIGGIIFAARWKYYQNIRELLATGQQVYAEITDIQENLHKNMGGRHPIIVHCRYQSPDGRLYLFHSHSVWCRSHEVDMKKKIPVYMDRQNPARYFVDVDAVL